ncbi:hypothetical protein CRM22_003695 [Opisthorchis felineus]|uniref:EGF-like domain-containing protein n=1 Tax=Opisthorchis felineus TaxID=147828 RepID=A0A4S2M0N8_OPIFE|nr:hypothetical protein CRM22_003695 [Opisthorchis felineus]
MNPLRMVLHIFLHLAIYVLSAAMLAAQSSENATSTTEASGNDPYLFFPLLHNLPASERTDALVGFKDSRFGTEALPVIEPKNKTQGRLSHLYFFQKESADICLTDPSLDEKQLIRLLHQHYKTTKRLFGTAVYSAETPSTPIPYSPTVFESRMQFVSLFCLKRHHFKNEYDFRNARFTIHPDYHQLCPNACGAPDRPPSSIGTSESVSRYKPCSLPSSHSPYISRQCRPSTHSQLPNREYYHCQCLPNATWFEQSKSCNFKYAALSGDCDPRGTLYRGAVTAHADSGGVRNYGSEVHAVRCVCKPNYYGTRCDKLKDPCTMSIGDALSGNVACAVSKGNKCIPYPELAAYSCICSAEYSRIPKSALLPKGRLLDNCLRQVDPCMVKACIHGTCVLTEQGTALEIRGKEKREPFTWLGRRPAVVARCLCNAGWTGEKCEHPLSLNGWTPWSQWSQCEPECQSFFRQNPPRGVQEMVMFGQSTPRWGMRQRTRFRDCIGHSSDCREEMQGLAAKMGMTIEDGETWRQYERRGCRPRFCDRHLFVAMGKRAVKRSAIQKQVRDTFQQAYTVHLSTMIAFAFLFTIFGFAAAFATKLYHESSYEKDATSSRDGAVDPTFTFTR